MDLLLVPEPDPATQAAVRAALRAAGVAVGTGGEAYRSAWRATGLAEALERVPGTDDGAGAAYTLWPRSTRGAARA